MTQWVLLVDRPEALPEIAQWHHEQWGRRANQTVSEIRRRLAQISKTETPSPYYFSRLKRAHSQLADIYADMKCNLFQTESIG